MSFKLKSLDAAEFDKLFQLSNLALEKMGGQKMIVDSQPGYPCRVSLQDAEIGEEVILLPYQHHNTSSPYKASGPIFVRKLAKTASLKINEIPIMFHHRLLSLRGYNIDGIMIAATVIEGQYLKEHLNQIFKNEIISYIHIHNAKPGCFNCLVERV